MHNLDLQTQENFVAAMETLNRLEDLLSEQDRSLQNKEYNALPDLFKAIQECQVSYENTAGNLPDRISDEQKRALAERLGALKRRNDELIVELAKKKDAVKGDMDVINKGCKISQAYSNMLKYYKSQRVNRFG